MMQQDEWRVEFHPAARKEFDRLDPALQASFDRIVELIHVYGLHNLTVRYAKPIKGKIWELRMAARGNIARALYITAVGRRLIVLHAFHKKTEKTPQKSIELAEKRAKEVALP
jgi:phage-related protein